MIDSRRTLLDCCRSGAARTALWLALLCFVAISLDAAVVKFPDPGLEAAIREAIAKPTGSIYDYHVKELEVLDASNRHIANLEGIQACENLIELDLRHNDISDVGPLARCAQLATLSLSDNHIADLAPLSTLKQLVILRLGGNLIADLTPLAALVPEDARQAPHLEELDLEENQITDLQALTGLVTLKRLTLYANQIVDISCLASLSALSFLHLNDNQIVDIQALAGLSRLKILLLDNNHVRDIDPLSGLAELLGLWLNGNEITDLSPLVEDAGLDFGDRVYVCGNPLVLTPGSDASAAIDALTRRGVYVYECSEE